MSDEQNVNTGEYTPEDEQQNVGAGGETSGDTGVKTEQVETTETTATDTAVDGAGSAADTKEEKASGETTDIVDPDASRTDFAEPGLKAGDACTCPDGRPGTVHRFDAGLICLPNQG